MATAQQEPKAPPSFLSLNQAAKIARVGRAYVAAAIEAGELKATRRHAAGKHYISRAHFESWRNGGN